VDAAADTAAAQGYQLSRSLIRGAAAVAGRGHVVRGAAIGQWHGARAGRGRLAGRPRQQTQSLVMAVIDRMKLRPGDLHLTRMRAEALRLPYPESVWRAVIGFIGRRPELREQVRTLTAYSFLREGPSGGPYVGNVHKVVRPRPPVPRTAGQVRQDGHRHRWAVTHLWHVLLWPQPGSEPPMPLGVYS